jgi:hypothetical protein
MPGVYHAECIAFKPPIHYRSSGHDYGYHNIWFVVRLPLRAYLLPFAIRAALEPLAARASGRKLNLTPWFPVAQVEDPDSPIPFPEDERLTAEVLATIVRTFDPRVYRPAVIEGTKSGGPAHYTGEYNEPLGWVTALDFDGVHLWAQCVEIVEPDGTGRIEDAVSTGHLGRSIGWWTDKAGVEGGKMLRHLALLASEPEGQTMLALPPLTHYFKDAFGAVEGARADTEKFITSPAIVPGATQQERSEMTPEEIEALSGKLEGAATRAIEAFRSDLPTQIASAVKDEVAKTETAFTGKLSDALKPVTDQIEALRTESTEKFAALSTEVEAAKAAATQQTARTREQGYRSDLKTLENELKITPAEVEPTVTALLAMPEEAATAYLGVLKGRSAIIGSAGRQVLQIQGDGDELTQIEIPDGADPATFEAAVRAEASLPADKKGDPFAFLHAAKPFLNSGRAN